MTLDELFQLYSRKRLRSASPRTLVLYKHSIRAFEKSMGRGCTVQDMTDDNLDDHMHRLVRDGLSPATANKDRAQIIAMWRFAHCNRLVEHWPNTPKMREPERVPLGWFPEEINAIMTSVDQENGFIAGVKASLWWRCLLNIILDTGERIGAVKRIQKKDVHGHYVIVPMAIRKGRTRDKLYSLTPETVSELCELMAANPTAEVFPWDRCETYIYNRFNKILDRANLPTDSRSKFHRIRRTVASAVANQGGNPTVALDHADVKTTKRYLDPRIVQERPTADYVRQWRRSRTGETVVA